jgi:hypothetical protein
MNINPHIERMNFENDFRVIAGREPDWYTSLDERTMMARVVFHNEDDEEELFDIPARYVTCHTCKGRGHHTDPNIDCCGISREEFDDDPDFEREYYAGRYDVECFGCLGKRVVAVIDHDRLSEKQHEILERIEERERENIEFESIARQERIMGC